MKKILKLRFLLPLLALGYVGAGIVVPRVDVPIGHLILAGLAAFGVIMSWFVYYRFSAGDYFGTIRRATVFWGCAAAGIGLSVALIVHVINAATGAQDVSMLYMVELVTAGVIIAASSAKLNDSKPAP